MEKVMKVASSSNVKSVAGSIAKMLETSDTVNIIAIGAGAVNQAVKSIALARGFIAVRGQNLYVAPGFTNVEVGTGIKLVVKVM